MRILVVVEKESRLQACCIHNALGTFVFLWDLAREFSKDSELHHWHSYFIKAHPLGSISWCNTLSSLLDIWVSLQSCEVRSPILHRRCNDTALTSNWLVAEIIHKVLLTIHLSVSNLDCVLELKKQFKIAFLENISVWVLVNSRNKPNSVYSEKRTKLILEIVLF